MSLGQLILVQVILKRFRRHPSSFVFTLMPIEANVEEPKNRSLIRLSALMPRLSNKKQGSKQWMQFVLEFQDTLQCLIGWSNWTGCANLSANRPEKSVLHTQFQTEKRQNATALEENWALYVKQTVPKFAALAVALDIRLLCSCEKHTWMNYFAEGQFKLGQAISERENIDHKSNLLGKNAVSKALEVSVRFIRTNFVKEMKKGCSGNGGVVSVDHVHLEVNGKHSCDFTIHFTGFQHLIQDLTQWSEEPAVSWHNRVQLTITNSKM